MAAADDPSDPALFPSSPGPRESLFARKLQLIRGDWRPGRVVAIVRAIMFQVRDGDLELMSPRGLAWVARDAEATQEKFSERAELLTRFAAGITAAVVAVVAPIIVKVSLLWKAISCAVALPLLMVAFTAYLSSETFKRAVANLGALVREIDEVRRRRSAQSPPYRTNVRVEAEGKPSLESETEQAQDSKATQARSRKKPS